MSEDVMWFRRGGGWAFLVPFLAGASLITISCGNGPPEREYAVPGGLCGLGVSEKEYAPLFGPGSEIRRIDDHEAMGSSEVRRQGCQYLVDEQPAVFVSGDWATEHDEAAPSTAEEGIRVHSTRAKPRVFAGRYNVLTWRKGAVAAIDCPRPRGDDDKAYSRYVLDIYATDTPLNDDPDRAHKVFGKLAQRAMAEVAKKLPCEGK